MDSPRTPVPRIELWRPDGDLDSDLRALAEVLHACVGAGASVSFIEPFTQADALAFWREQVLPGVQGGSRYLLVTRDQENVIVGTVQLALAQPPNQRHRADVLKMLVHPSQRRRGLARTLMQAVEELARSLGRTLLTLDTRTGDAAEPLYRSLGYQLIGVVPRYSRHQTDPDRFDAASFYYKEL